MPRVHSDRASSSSSSSPNPSPSETEYAAELKRKALHVASLIIPLGMAELGKPAALFVLLPLASLAVGADVLRVYAPGFNRFIDRYFGSMMRSGERPAPGDSVVLNGATWVLVSAALLTLLFPLRIAVPVFTMFLIADATAAIIGRRLGRIHWGSSHRTVEGSLAFLVTGIGTMALFPLPLGIGAAGVVVAGIVEALPLRLNDNVRVPLAAALTIVLLEGLTLG